VKSPTPKTLLFDIECTPNRGWYYDEKKEYNILDTDQYSFIHSVAYQWEGEKKIHVISLPDFPLYKRKRIDDYALIRELHKLFDQADVLIGHNGDNFDIKKVNARLIYHRFTPPAPYKTDDTLKLARKVQNSGSNRLDALAKYYGIGAKLPNRGKDLWLPIAKGIATDNDWEEMRAYNKHDVYLMAELWPLLRPWGKTTNVNVLTRTMGACPKCGGTDLEHRGYNFTRTTESPKLRCKNIECGAWSQGKAEPLAKRVHIR
jgi:DNA polymerase elongation subunit (family B)